MSSASFVIVGLRKGAMDFCAQRSLCTNCSAKLWISAKFWISSCSATGFGVPEEGVTCISAEELSSSDCVTDIRFSSLAVGDAVGVPVISVGTLPTVTDTGPTE